MNSEAKNMALVKITRHVQASWISLEDILEEFKAIVRNFYMSVNICFTQATTRGDDTTLIKPFGSSNTSRYFSVFVLFVFGVLGRHSRAGA